RPAERRLAARVARDRYASARHRTPGASRTAPVTTIFTLTLRSHHERKTRSSQNSRSAQRYSKTLVLNALTMRTRRASEASHAPLGGAPSGLARENTNDAWLVSVCVFSGQLDR